MEVFTNKLSEHSILMHILILKLVYPNIEAKLWPPLHPYGFQKRTELQACCKAFWVCKLVIQSMTDFGEV